MLKHRLGAHDLACERRGGVPLWADFTALRTRHLRRFDVDFPELLVGGTPCQAFSVSGARRGLADTRGNLTLAFVRLAHALRNAGPLRHLIWENVPGILSMPDNAFGCFLAGIVGSDGTLALATRTRTVAAFRYGCRPLARAAWRVTRLSMVRIAPTARACLPCGRFWRRNRSRSNTF